MQEIVGNMLREKQRVYHKSAYYGLILVPFGFGLCVLCV